MFLSVFLAMTEASMLLNFNKKLELSFENLQLNCGDEGDCLISFPEKLQLLENIVTLTHTLFDSFKSFDVKDFGPQYSLNLYVLEGKTSDFPFRDFESFKSTATLVLYNKTVSHLKSLLETILILLHEAYSSKDPLVITTLDISLEQFTYDFFTDSDSIEKKAKNKLTRYDLKVLKNFQSSKKQMVEISMNLFNFNKDSLFLDNRHKQFSKKWLMDFWNQLVIISNSLKGIVNLFYFFFCYNLLKF